MRRRDVVAGVGSLGTLGGAVHLVRNGPPQFGDEDADGEASSEGTTSTDGPIDVETIDARGSESGSMSVPSDRATVVMFFVNGCGTCQVQAGRIADAKAALEADHGDDVRFLSVTYDSREQIPPDDLREWWDDHGGNGSLSYDASELMRRYSAVGYPVTIVLDTDGDEHWRETGTTHGSDLARAVKSVIDGDDELGRENSGNETNESDETNETTDDPDAEG
jgi:hypothetical protein